MKATRILITDAIGSPNAILQSFGAKVFDVVAERLSSGDKVILDFAGVANITSGFCNASIGQLYTVFSDIADSHIHIENIDHSSIWYEKIQDSIELAVNPEKSKIIDSAILALFD